MLAPARSAALRSGAPGSVNESYRSYADWLQATSADEIARKREEADIVFHRIGITFAVYGENAGQERLIPFDLRRAPEAWMEGTPAIATEQKQTQAQQ